jgi:hypothetical protein
MNPLIDYSEETLQIDFDYIIRYYIDVPLLFMKIYRGVLNNVKISAEDLYYYDVMKTMIRTVYTYCELRCLYYK